MATMPMQPTQAGADPGQGDPSQGDQSDGGYTIEIEVSAQGQMTVSVETADQEGAEQPGQEDDGAGDMPVSNVREACKLVEQIVANNGQMPGGQNQMSVQDAFGQGFQGAAG
jgi:hypothetical protein